MSERDCVRKDFHEFLVYIANQISSDDLEKMKFYLNNDKYQQNLNKEELDNASCVHMFEMLQKANILSEENINVLIKLLKVANQHRLAKEVETYKTNVQVVNSIPNNVSPDMVVKHFKETEKFRELKRHMNETDVAILAGLVGSGKSQMAVKYGCQFKKQNTQSVVWRINARDKSGIHCSLKVLAEELKQPWRFFETKDTDEVLLAMSQNITDSLVRVNDAGKHLLIFDDVQEECEEVVERLIDRFLVSNHVKVVVTTNNDLFLRKFVHVTVNGFTEIEALHFLGFDPKTKDHILELARKMSCLPLGLNAAKTYMESVKITAKKFNRSFVKSIEKIEDQMENLRIQKEKFLFKMLKMNIENLKKVVDEDVYILFLCFQFLEADDVPLLLLSFMTDEDPILKTDHLVQVIQKFSFGSVHGKDDQRTISLHSAVLIALGQMVTKQQQCQLLKRVLWAIVFLYGKDVRNPKDLERNRKLLPHACAALKMAEKVFVNSDDSEDIFLHMFLNDLIRYTCSFEGLFEISERYGDRAKMLCFKLVQCEESDLVDMARKRILDKECDQDDYMPSEEDQNQTGGRQSEECSEETSVKYFRCAGSAAESRIPDTERKEVQCYENEDTFVKVDGTEGATGCSKVVPAFTEGTSVKEICQDEETLVKEEKEQHDCFYCSPVERTEENERREYCSLHHGKVNIKLLSKYKAEIFAEKMREFCVNNREFLSVFVPKFIVKKHLNKFDAKTMEEGLNDSLERDNCLTVDEYNCLSAKGKAVPLALMYDTLLLELCLSVFCTNARRFNYEDIGNMERITEFIGDALFAEQIGVILQKELPKYQPIYSMIAKRNGTLEMACDSPDIWCKVTGEDKESLLLDAYHQYRSFLGEQRCYYSRGILKADTKSDTFHRTMCLNRLICCIRQILLLDIDEERKSRFSQMGLQFISDLEKQMPKKGWSAKVFRTNIARLLFVVPDNLQDNLEKAESLFTEACPCDLFTDNECSAKLEYLVEENNAVIGLSDCYCKQGKRNEAAALLEKFKKRLNDSGQKKMYEEVCKKIDEVLLKGEQAH